MNRGNSGFWHHGRVPDGVVLLACRQAGCVVRLVRNTVMGQKLRRTVPCSGARERKAAVRRLADASRGCGVASSGPAASFASSGQRATQAMLWPVTAQACSLCEMAGPKPAKRRTLRSCAPEHKTALFPLVHRCFISIIEVISKDLTKISKENGQHFHAAHLTYKGILIVTFAPPVSLEFSRISCPPCF